MALVIVTRHINRHRRTVNGAWVFGGRDESTFAVDEAELDKRFSIGDGIEVEWNDGTKESAFSTNVFPGYPPRCIPADGRLAKLLGGRA